MKIKTNISQAFWCITKDGVSDFEPANFSFGRDGSKNEITWLDELLEGGIEMFSSDIFQGNIANNKIMPITFLITGPPGSGKTTLAMELCYRMAKEENKLAQYITTESDSFKLIENAISFGYEKAEDIIVRAVDVPEFGRGHSGSFVLVVGKEQLKEDNDSGIKQKSATQRSAAFTDILNVALELAANRILGAGSGQKLLELKQKYIDEKDDILKSFSPDILVIDSLNIIEKEERKDFFQKLLTDTKYGGSGLLICIIDDPSPDNQYSSWSHVCNLD